MELLALGVPVSIYLSSKCEVGLTLTVYVLFKAHFTLFPQSDLLEKVLDFLMSPKSSGRVSVSGILNFKRIHI